MFILVCFHTYLSAFSIEEGYVTFATENYFPLLKVMLQSHKEFSKKPIVVFGINGDIPFSEKEFPLMVKKRIDEDLSKVCLFYLKPKIILDSGIKFGAYIEADDLLTSTCDTLFQYARRVNNHPLCPIHPNPPSSFNRDMKYFFISEQSMPYVHGHIIFSYKCLNFIKQWYETCLSLPYTPYNFDETVLNVLLWKYRATTYLPLHDPFYKHGLKLLKGDKSIPEYKDKEVICHMIHGCKKPSQAEEILKELKKLSKK